MTRDYSGLLKLLQEKYGAGEVGQESSENWFHHVWPEFEIIQSTWYGETRYIPRKPIRKVLKHLGVRDYDRYLFDYQTSGEINSIKTPEKAFKAVVKYHNKLKKLLAKAN